MTATELAATLDEIEYDKLVNFNQDVKEIFEQAKENDLVIVFGASDDLMEFRGAIDDEADCYNGGYVMFNKNGTGNDAMSGNCILANWCDGDIAWTYETEIPHETFNIMDDGEIYCLGIVFCIDDLK